MNRASLLVVVGMATLGASACREGADGAPPADVGVVVPRGSVRAVIQQDTTAGDGTITFIVRVQTRDVTVSSFQGAVTFAPGAFTLVSSQTPQGQAGESFVLNPAGFSEGRIRFAALTTTKFLGTDAGDGAEAFRFTVRALRPVPESGLVATLDVVGTDAGKAISADRILASAAVKNASRNIAK